MVAVMQFVDNRPMNPVLQQVGRRQKKIPCKAKFNQALQREEDEDEAALQDRF